MIKEAFVDQAREAEEFAAHAPAKDAESVRDYVRRARIHLAKLDNALASPQAIFGSAPHLELERAREIVAESLDKGEVLMRSILAETPQADDDGAYADVNAADFAAGGFAGGGIDVRASVISLAMKVAEKTLFMSPAERLAEGMQAFRETIEPHLPQDSDYRTKEAASFPREEFGRLLSEFAAMTPAQLRAASERIAEDRTDNADTIEELFGFAEENDSPQPDPVDTVDNDAPEVELAADGAPDTDTSVDEIFEETIEENREFMGIDSESPLRRVLDKSSRRVAGKHKKRTLKATHIRIAAVPEGLDEFGIEDDAILDTVQELADAPDATPDSDETTYWVEHEGELFGFDEADVVPLAVVPAEDVEVASDIGDAAEAADGSTAGGSEDSDDSETRRESSRRRSSRASRQIRQAYLVVRPGCAPRELAAHGIDPAGVEGQLQRIAEITEDEAGKTLWVEHEDEFFGFAPEDVETYQVVPEDDVEIIDAPGEGSGSSTGSGSDDSEKKESSRGRRRSRRLAVEDTSGQNGYISNNEAPEPRESFESVIERGGDYTNQSANRPEPRGPNRRRPNDVPAYDTPKEKLTARKARRVQAALREAGYDVDLRDVGELVGIVSDTSR